VRHLARIGWVEMAGAGEPTQEPAEVQLHIQSEQAAPAAAT